MAWGIMYIQGEKKPVFVNPAHVGSFLIDRANAHLRVLDAQPVEVLLNALVCPLGRLL